MICPSNLLNWSAKQAKMSAAEQQQEQEQELIQFTDKIDTVTTTVIEVGTAAIAAKTIEPKTIQELNAAVAIAETIRTAPASQVGFNKSESSSSESPDAITSVPAIATTIAASPEPTATAAAAAAVAAIVAIEIAQTAESLTQVCIYCNYVRADALRCALRSICYLE